MVIIVATSSMTRAAASDSSAVAAEGRHGCVAMGTLGAPARLQSRGYHLGMMHLAWLCRRQLMTCDKEQTAVIPFLCEI